jgi:uncharacterized 2Fe-2S/4Fe-4S cluster protein (DUF4445 family)
MAAITVKAVYTSSSIFCVDTMNQNTYTISLPSQDRRIAAKHGQKLLEALINEGILLRADCGGKGRCGKCLIKILEAGESGVSLPSQVETDTLGKKDIQSGYRLACHTEISGNIAVDIPEHSLLSPEVAHKGPNTLKEPLPVPKVPYKFSNDYGIAVDLGTTTIAVYLCDFSANKVTGATSMRNPQIIYGDDVMSRITAVHRKSHLLNQLQKMAVKAIEWGILYLCRSARLDTGRLRRMVVVGNTTMIHLFAGIDPSSIGLHPYTPRFTEEKIFRAGTIGFSFNPTTEIITLPLISGFLGSDILAAAVASDFESSGNGSVLVDIGTNGEVMLCNGSGVSATSCATGPAFEGAAIRHGMHGVSGAIDGAKIDPKTGEASCSVIQKDPTRPKKPSGICGSGVVSLAAELYRTGIISRDGRFKPEHAADFFQTGDNGMTEYIVMKGEKTLSGRAITFTQKDVRAIQLAKGALSAGIRLLCRESGYEQPRKILVAGAFGSYIQAEDALSIGMFTDISPSDIVSVGNAAGAGAILALFDESQRKKTSTLTMATKVLDLAGHPDFQETFIEMLSFPK